MSNQVESKLGMTTEEVAADVEQLSKALNSVIEKQKPTDLKTDAVAQRFGFMSVLHKPTRTSALAAAAYAAAVGASTSLTKEALLAIVDAVWDAARGLQTFQKMAETYDERNGEAKAKAAEVKADELMPLLPDSGKVH